MTMTTLEKTVLKDLHLKNKLLRTSECSLRTRLEYSKDKTDVEKDTLKNFDLELIIFDIRNLFLGEGMLENTDMTN